MDFENLEEIMDFIKTDIRKRAKDYHKDFGVLDLIEVRGIDFVFYPYIRKLHKEICRLKQHQLECNK